jgi:hypothetical protein
VPCFGTPKFYPDTMPKHTWFFTKALTQTIAAIELMASPEGTTIMGLTKLLSITRRSVFRLLRTIEHDLNIPITVSREVFGGIATYRIPSSFVETLSHISILPSISSLQNNILLYLVFNDDVFKDKQGSTTKT